MSEQDMVNVTQVEASNGEAVTEHHFYYYDPNRVNLDAMRDQAYKLSVKGDYFGHKRECVIHYHAYLALCKDKEHEYFPAGGKKEEDEDVNDPD